LIGATALRLQEAVAGIHERGGLAIAAHIDRESFSVLSQLGFIPEDLFFDAIEISRRMELNRARTLFKQNREVAFITASDAHAIEDIGASPTRMQVARPDMAELRLAIGGTKGRKVV
jgi:PHP family Zn ribbon phosphoesterase